MAGVSFNGISSGIDTASIIQATLDAQRGPITTLQNKESAYNTQISTLAKVASKMDELKTLADDMGKTSNVLAYTLKVSDEDTLAATADGDASAGEYEVNVTQLAVAEKDRSGAFASDFSSVKAGTLTIQTAGDTTGPHQITIAQGDTLDDVVGKINSSGAGVQASIVRDGTSSYLQVVASDSGYTIGGTADDAITISESYTGTDGTALGLTQVTQAKNALLTVDGLPVTSRDNTTSNVISGVSLQLKKIGTSTIEIAPDKDGTKTKLQSFVDKVNELGSMIRSATHTSDGSRIVEPDPTLDRLASDLHDALSNIVDGVSGSSNSLSRIGITTSTTGDLQIDSDKLDKSLATDLRGVGRLFTQSDTGLSAKLDKLLKSYTDTVDGPISNRKKALNQRIDQLDSQISTMNDRLDKLGQTMQKQFSAMEQAIQNFHNQGSALSSLYG